MIPNDTSNVKVEVTIEKHSCLRIWALPTALKRLSKYPVSQSRKRQKLPKELPKNIGKWPDCSHSRLLQPYNGVQTQRRYRRSTPGHLNLIPRKENFSWCRSEMEWGTNLNGLNKPRQDYLSQKALKQL